MLTQPRVFDLPVPVERAVEVLGQIIDHPGVVNLITDAGHAVLTTQDGAVLITGNRDFA